MHVTPEIGRLIDMLSEAKVHLLVAVHTPVGSPERAEELRRLHATISAARKLVDEAMGGIRKLPGALAVELLVGEKGLERLGGPKAPPIEGTPAPRPASRGQESSDG